MRHVLLFSFIMVFFSSQAFGAKKYQSEDKLDELCEKLLTAGKEITELTYTCSTRKIVRDMSKDQPQEIKLYEGNLSPYECIKKQCEDSYINGVCNRYGYKKYKFYTTKLKSEDSKIWVVSSVSCTDPLDTKTGEVYYNPN